MPSDDATTVDIAPTEKVPREIWVMVAAAFTIAIGYGLIAPLLPQFVVSFDVSMAAAGFVVSIFSVSRLLFAPAAGRLVDRIGTRHVYLTGLLVVAIATGMVALSQAFWHIAVLRGIAGIGSTMFTISAMGLLVRLSPPSIRGRCAALYASAFLLGNVAGPLVGASMSFLGFRWPFVIYGVAVGLAAWIVAHYMPKVKGASTSAAQREPMLVKEAWQDTAYRASLSAGFAHGWINMGVRVAVLPLFAAAIFHNGAAAAGFALAAFAAGNAAVLQFSGRLADVVGRRPLIIVGMVGSGLFMGVLGFSTAVWSLIVSSVLAGAASGLINPSLQAALGDIVGQKRSGGKVLSTFQMAGDLGQICGPIAIGLLADLYGFQTAFLACGLVAAIGMAGWVFAREPRTPLAKPSRLSQA